MPPLTSQHCLSRLQRAMKKRAAAEPGLVNLRPLKPGQDPVPQPEHRWRRWTRWVEAVERYAEAHHHALVREHVG